MSHNLDFGPFYNTSGTLLQPLYAQKSVSKGSTSLALKSSEGIVILRASKKKSPLFINSLNKKIKKLKPTIFLTYSGLENDFNFLCQIMRDNLEKHTEHYKEMVSNTNYLALINKYTNIFTRYWSLRPLALNVISGVFEQSDNSYNLYMTDTTGLTKSYRAIAVGKGENAAKTELEKLELKNMTIKEMIDEGLKILDKVHDPLKDAEFDVEIACLGKETDNMFKRYNN